MAVPYKVPLAPTQKDSRGFFRGPADETPWNNDRSWIQHGLYFCFEKLQVQFVTHAVFFHFSERLSKNCLDFKQTIQNPAATKSSVCCYMRYCFGNMDSIFHKGWNATTQFTREANRVCRRRLFLVTASSSSIYRFNFSNVQNSFRSSRWSAPRFRRHWQTTQHWCNGSESWSQPISTFSIQSG